MPEILDEDLVTIHQPDLKLLKQQERKLAKIAVFFIVILNILNVAYGYEFVDMLVFSIALAPIIAAIIALFFNLIPYQSFSYQTRLIRMILIVLNALFLLVIFFYLFANHE